MLSHRAHGDGKAPESPLPNLQQSLSFTVSGALVSELSQEHVPAVPKLVLEGSFFFFCVYENTKILVGEGYVRVVCDRTNCDQTQTS